MMESRSGRESVGLQSRPRDVWCGDETADERQPETVIPVISLWNPHLPLFLEREIQKGRQGDTVGHLPGRTTVVSN